VNEGPTDRGLAERPISDLSPFRVYDAQLSVGRPVHKSVTPDRRIRPDVGGNPPAPGSVRRVQGNQRVLIRPVDQLTSGKHQFSADGILEFPLPNRFSGRIDSIKSPVGGGKNNAIAGNHGRYGSR
jgi:hypothetical protein